MKLYQYPLSSYCQKTAMALHEKGVRYTAVNLNPSDPEERAELLKIYPLGKIPVAVLDHDHRIPESSIIIEYADTQFDGPRLIPTDPEASRQTRFQDRVIDLYLNDSISTLLFQSWKPADRRDPERIETAKFRAGVMYGFMQQRLDGRTWLMGDEFTLADCAAAPALFYAQRALPFDGHARVVDYWQRLSARPSWKAVMDEAAPFLKQLEAA